tara:strand:+ start:366 stop:746 length:381 start_codon:yes stop_codon:yes gene_type:complete
MQILQLEFKKKQQVQLDLFASYMPQDLIEEYKIQLKAYKKIQRRLYRMHRNLVEMNQEPDLNLLDENGLVNLDVYRIEKQWKHLKKRVKDTLNHLNEEKELLEEWFRAFAQLLDLKNKKYNPMGYH